MSDTTTGAVYLASPSYDGTVQYDTLAIALLYSTNRKKLTTKVAGSLLCHNFNIAWSDALNKREEHGIEWFAMLHGDIVPNDHYWIDTLIAEAETFGADMMSAVVPIKNHDGLTSTAIENVNDPWEVLVRLSLKQVNHESFPETFDNAMALNALALLPEPLKCTIPGNPRLLANTGCMVIRLDRPWVEDLYFQTHDKVRRRADGKFEVCVQPEDWLMSKAIAERGGKVMVTKKFSVQHKGMGGFHSNETWGRDRDFLAEKNSL